MVNQHLTMSKSNSILIVFFLAAILGKQVAAQPPTKPNYFGQICRTKMGNYTTNSIYEANLRSVLFDLQGRASIASFSNTTAGSGEDQVYGHYYCRGDIDLSLCHNCIQEATQTVFQNCSNIKAAVVWYYECTLRYQNISMVGVMSDIPALRGFGSANVTDPDKFTTVLENTMGRVINESAYGNTSAAAHFATGEGAVSQFVTVYCLVQCSPDLNGTQCETCLRSAYDYTPHCCGNWPQLALVFYPSCQVRYSTEGAFYPLSNAPPPPPSLPPPYPPPPVVATSPPIVGSAVKLGTRDSTTLGIVIAAIAFFMLQVNT